MFPLHPESSSHLPPHPNPLGCLRAPALSTLIHASNLHWLSVLHMVIYMFQCYLSNHSTLTLSHIVQKSVLYMGLFCCLAYGVIFTIFLYSMYMKFRKMVMMTLYVRQQKRCRYKEQIFGLCGRRRGWDDLRE